MAAGQQGEVTERPKVHAWRACCRASGTWVRIPPSPPLDDRYNDRYNGRYNGRSSGRQRPRHDRRNEKGEGMPAFESLAVWRKAHELALSIYQMTVRLPGEEKFGLTSQLRRAAVSVAANIVEGHARQSQGDFARFVSIALGSAAELQYLLLLCRDLGYVSATDIQPLISQIAGLRRMLDKLRDELKSTS